jgi:hypothetical protein
VSWDDQTIVVRETKGSNQRVVSLGTASTRALILPARERQQGAVAVHVVGRAAPHDERAQAQPQRAFEVASVESKGIHAFRRASGITYLQAMVDGDLQAAGIHAFRRASGIAYLHQGGQAEDLRVLMGWRSPEMIRRYVKRQRLSGPRPRASGLAR